MPDLTNYSGCEFAELVSDCLGSFAQEFYADELTENKRPQSSKYVR